jgi:hypothetical protein
MMRISIIGMPRLGGALHLIVSASVPLPSEASNPPLYREKKGGALRPACLSPVFRKAPRRLAAWMRLGGLNRLSDHP